MLTVLGPGADWHAAKHLRLCLNNILTKEQYDNYPVRVIFCKQSPYKINDNIRKIYSKFILTLFSLFFNDKI